MTREEHGMTVSLTLYEDRIAPDRTLNWVAAPRGLFVRAGAIRVERHAAAPLSLRAEACALVTEPLRIAGDGEIWTFELARRPISAMAGETAARVVLAHDLDLDPDQPLLFRADRIRFAAGGVTPRHGHRGPGIRRLLYGRLAAEIGDMLHRIEAGNAWFETGNAPVIGRNLAPASSFVRALVLDPALKGQPTFLPWTPEDAAKTRGVRPELYFDEIVTLPAPG